MMSFQLIQEGHFVTGQTGKQLSFIGTQVVQVILVVLLAKHELHVVIVLSVDLPDQGLDLLHHLLPLQTDQNPFSEQLTHLPPHAGAIGIIDTDFVDLCICATGQLLGRFRSIAKYAVDSNAVRGGAIHIIANIGIATNPLIKTIISFTLIIQLLFHNR